MTFSSTPKMIAIRTLQVLTLLFSFALTTGQPHREPYDVVFQLVWYTALCAAEWFGFNIVHASLDVNGMVYHRFFGTRFIPWSKIHSATLWRSAGGVILRLEDRSILRRYKFLLDSYPGIEIVTDDNTPADVSEIAQLRRRLIGSII